MLGLKKPFQRAQWNTKYLLESLTFLTILTSCHIMDIHQIKIRAKPDLALNIQFSYRFVKTGLNIPTFIDTKNLINIREWHRSSLSNSSVCLLHSSLPPSNHGSHIDPYGHNIIGVGLHMDGQCKFHPRFFVEVYSCSLNHLHKWADVTKKLPSMTAILHNQNFWKTGSNNRPWMTEPAVSTLWTNFSEFRHYGSFRKKIFWFWFFCRRCSLENNVLLVILWWCLKSEMVFSGPTWMGSGEGTHTLCEKWRFSATQTNGLGWRSDFEWTGLGGRLPGQAEVSAAQRCPRSSWWWFLSRAFSSGSSGSPGVSFPAGPWQPWRLGDPISGGWGGQAAHWTSGLAHLEQNSELRTNSKTPIH